MCEHSLLLCWFAVRFGVWHMNFSSVHVLVVEICLLYGGFKVLKSLSNFVVMLNLLVCCRLGIEFVFLCNAQYLLVVSAVVLHLHTLRRIIAEGIAGLAFKGTSNNIHSVVCRIASFYVSYAIWITLLTCIIGDVTIDLEETLTMSDWLSNLEKAESHPLHES